MLTTPAYVGMMVQEKNYGLSSQEEEIKPCGFNQDAAQNRGQTTRQRKNLDKDRWKDFENRDLKLYMKGEQWEAFRGYDIYEKRLWGDGVRAEVESRC